MKKTLLGLALAACISTSAMAGNDQTGLDAFAQYAIDHAPEDVEDLRAEPDFSSTYGMTFEVFGGSLTATYGGDPKGGWLLISYTYEPGPGEARSSPSGAPDVPDPDPPTQPNSEGATRVSTWSVGNWHYTAHYTYGVRDGVLGWHLDSMSAEYKPQGPGGTQQQK